MDLSFDINTNIGKMFLKIDNVLGHCFTSQQIDLNT